MIYGFNDDKEKVDIQNLLDTLEANYQNNVNTIYNAIVSAGITPTAKTPVAIKTGIDNIIKAIYDALSTVGTTPTAKTTTACTTSINTIINTMYNAIVSAGITPTAKTTAACKTGIDNIIKAIYDALVSVGSTPTAKTTAACTTGINNIMNTIYNAIVSAGITPTAKTTSALVTAINCFKNPFTVKSGWYQIDLRQGEPTRLLFAKIGKYTPRSGKLTLPIISGTTQYGEAPVVSAWTINTSGSTIHSYLLTGTKSGTNYIFNFDITSDANLSNFDYVQFAVVYDMSSGGPYGSPANGYAEANYYYKP